MKLSEAITHRIANDKVGEGVGRDEKGWYATWDSVLINMNTGEVTLLCRGISVGSVGAFRGPIERDTDNIHVVGLEGRLRVTPG